MTLTLEVAGAVKEMGLLSNTISSKFFNAGVLPTLPNRLTGARLFTGVCGNTVNAAVNWSTAFAAPWSSTLVSGTCSGTAKLVSLQTQTPFGDLIKLLDEELSSTWAANALELDLALGGTNPEVKIEQALPYCGKVVHETSCFIRVVSHTSNLSAEIFRNALSGEQVGLGWKHYANQDVGILKATRLRFVGTGTIKLQLALPYLASGSHSGAPVFDF